MAPVALCTAQSLNETSLFMGLRVWHDHADNQKGAALFFFFPLKKEFLFISLCQSLGSGISLTEGNAWAMSEWSASKID